jgi:Tfp pilus assembly protein PilW
MSEFRVPRRSIHAATIESGFSLVEFLLASLVLLLVAGYMFSAMAEMERTAGYQSEIQSVTGNTRIAMEIVQRYIRQAGNNPQGIIGLQGLSVVSPNQIVIKADLTGSSLTDPDQGDPDGDINDLDEDVTLRYNAAQRTIEIVPAGGPARTVAGSITAFAMLYLDQFGALTTDGNAVQRIRVTISGGSRMVNPQTRQPFGITEVCDVQLISR